MPITPRPDEIGAAAAAAAAACPDPLAHAVVSAGYLMLAREVCERYLREVDAVALLQRDDEMLIVPLTRESAGGLLLKQRNARGDRVIAAQEFFRTHGYGERAEPTQVAMHWDDVRSALVLRDLPLSGPSANFVY